MQTAALTQTFNLEVDESNFLFEVTDLQNSRFKVSIQRIDNPPYMGYTIDNYLSGTYKDEEHPFIVHDQVVERQMKPNSKEVFDMKFSDDNINIKGVLNLMGLRSNVIGLYGDLFYGPDYTSHFEGLLVKVYKGAASPIEDDATSPLAYPTAEEVTDDQETSLAPSPATEADEAKPEEVTVEAAKAVKKFKPTSVKEEHDLSVWGDDYVKTIGKRDKPLSTAQGDTVQWDHTYTKGGAGGYESVNQDLADITALRLHGTGNQTVIETKLTFTANDGSTKTYDLGISTWFGSKHLVSNKADILGNLRWICIKGFVIEVRVVSPGKAAMKLSQIDFGWDASDIEKSDHIENCLGFQ